MNSPSIYYGVYNPPTYPDFSGTQAFEAMTGKRVAIVHGYTQWGRTDGAQNFHVSWFDQVRAHGSIPMLTWEPWYGNEAAEPAFQLRNIYNGTYDAYIARWAQDSKAWGHPYFLRFAHEMNGDWYPWCEQANGGRPGDYVRAWRRVHDIFTANGVTNVTWVWCPNIEEPGYTPLAGLYPGDGYVDWVAMDGYNFGGRTFFQVFDQTYRDLQRLAPTKPVMIAETSSVEDGSKPYWISDGLARQLQQNFPNIKALVWFNENFSERNDWVIHSFVPSLNAFNAGIASQYYTENTFGHIDSSPILPIGAPSSGITVHPTPPPRYMPTNLIQDSSFENPGSDGSSPWSFNVEAGAQASISQVSDARVDGNYSVKISVMQGHEDAWLVQLQQGSIPLSGGRTYTISFWAKASRPREITVIVQQDYSPYEEYLAETIDITTSWQQYVLRFTQPQTDTNTLFSFNVAQATGDVWFDRVELQE